MKNLYLRKVLLAAVFSSFLQYVSGQCPAGWNGGQCTVKWDNRNYLVTTGNYLYNAGTGLGVSAAMSTTQAFSIGTNRVTIVMGAGITTVGQNTTNTAFAGSYGSGNAVQYSGSGAITLTFDTVVANLQFSLYNIDVSQTATVTAKDGSGTPVSLNVVMGVVLAGRVAVTGSGTTTAVATAATNVDAANDTRGTVNVSIAGFTPGNGVKTVTITMGGTAGSFWLSDLTACVFSDFPGSTYYNIAKPYSGEDAYIIGNPNNNTATEVDLATGKSKFIMQDAGFTPTNKWLNSFAYDPYNHYFYYVYDESYTSGTVSAVPGTNRKVKKYDFNTLSGLNATMTSGTQSVLIADVTQAPFNIPCFDGGIESGASCFNNGSLYLGIEGTNVYTKIGGSFNSSSRYSMVWRIDFDASNNPIKACQVFATLADNGSGTIKHDWGDITVNDGIMYDFNGGAGSTGTGSSFIHYSLQTGVIVNTYPYGTKLIPGQSGIGWDGTVYRLSSYADTVGAYNVLGTGKISGNVLITPVGVGSLDWTSTGSGDGSDAFKPPLDYGDAPASFDPVAGDPATHDYDSTLKLGTYWNAEFAKKVTVDASGDGLTDDGITILPVFTHNQNYYDAYIKVYNHSGAAAKLAGWIDFNNDGVFQSGEGVVVSVPTSSTNIQTIHLAWGPVSTIPLAATSVFMRIRLTSGANTLTTATPTGFLSNGEVEDYKVNIDNILPVKLISFKASPVNNVAVNVQWNMASEMNMQQYTIERSDDEINWQTVISEKPYNNPEGTRAYEDNDNSPLPGRSYYRLKMVDYTGAVTYSEIDKVDMGDAQFSVAKITPNPFQSMITIKAALPESGNMIVNVIDASGKSVRTYQQFGNKGKNTIVIDNLGALTPGVYIVEVTGNGVGIKQKLVKE